jgi:hypothetical protein
MGVYKMKARNIPQIREKLGKQEQRRAYFALLAIQYALCPHLKESECKRMAGM